MTTDDQDRPRYLERLRSYAGAGDPRMTRAVFDRMRESGVQPDAEAYRLLLGVYTKVRDLEGAQQVVAQMAADGIQADADTTAEVVLGYARAGQTARALDALDDMRARNLRPSSRYAQPLLSLTITAGRYPAARAMLRAMAEDGTAAAPQEYRRLLDECLERRAIKDSRHILDIMIEVGRPPTSQQVTSVATMMARAGHPDRAQELLERVQDHVDVEPAVQTEILLAHARAGRTDDAAAVLDRLAQAGVEASSLHRNAILTSQLAAKDLEGAWQTALSLGNAGGIPTSDNLEGLFELSREQGSVDLAAGVIDWMSMLGVQAQPQHVAQIIDGYARQGRVDDARRMLDDAVRSGAPVDRRQARNVADAYVKAGRLDEARVLLDQLSVSRTLTQGKHYGPLLSALLRAKRHDHACEVIEALLARKAQPPASQSSAVVLHLVKQDQLAEALDLLERLAAADVSIAEEDYRELMWSFAKKHRVEQTQRVYELLVGAGITPDDRHEKALAWARGQIAQRLPDEDDEDDGAT
ncbi:MAG TPA: hypothetical protein VGA69_04635 [Nitriliruptorales bacterium]